MRTTLTLDDDVAAKLKHEVQRTGSSFKKTVNTILRLGLVTVPRTQTAKPFKVHARDLRAKPGFDFANVGEVLEQVDGPLYR